MKTLEGNLVSKGIKIGIVAARFNEFITSKLLGCFLPIAADRLHMDPAVMASPLITTIADAISLLVYFQIAVALLHI